MPLLARMVSAPLCIDVRRGAIARLGELLADRRIATEGRVAVAVGPSQGDQIAKDLRPTLGSAEVMRVRDGSVDAAVELGSQLRGGSYEAVVGIGGGKTLDVTKYAASLAGIPMVSVATNLSHDGICSPVSSLEHEKGKGSFGVSLPLAIVVDLDYVRAAPENMVRSGVGDVVSNFSAIADWELSAHATREPVDGLAVTLSRTAAEAVLHRPDSIESDAFLTALAEALVLSGMAMSTAGSSRPGSGSCHEILHAIDHLYPGTSNHGELAGIGALFSFYLREDEVRFAEISACLEQHKLPRLPGDVGLTNDQFAKAVSFAPSTRPGRYTILEHLALPDDEIRARVDAYVGAMG